MITFTVEADGTVTVTKVEQVVESTDNKLIITDKHKEKAKPGDKKDTPKKTESRKYEVPKTGIE